MYKIAICDDETDYREMVIRKIQSLNLCGTPAEFFQFRSGEELLASPMDFDLLFLDIQMPGKDGNQVSVQFRRHNRDCVLVFCTNYQAPRTENFKVNPYRYIMKDLENRELSKELPDILQEMMDRARKNYLSVTQDGSLTRIPADSIEYLTVEGRKVRIICDFGGLIDVYSREKLKELYAELDQECFVYAHASYIVNMKRIIHVEGKEITMDNGHKIYISRAKAKDFDEAFSRFLNRRFRR